MEAILASESWNASWLLPAGAALIALGLTAIGAALWRLAIRHSSAGVERGELDIQDSTPAVIPTPSAEDPIGDATARRQLNSRIEALEKIFDQVAEQTLSRAKHSRRPRVGLRFAAGAKPATSSETRALAALVARGNDVRPNGRQSPRMQKATT